MRASVRDLVTRLEFLSKTITSELFYQSQPIEPSHVYTEGVILWLGLMRRYSLRQSETPFLFSFSLSCTKRMSS